MTARWSPFVRACPCRSSTRTSKARNGSGSCQRGLRSPFFYVPGAPPWTVSLADAVPAPAAVGGTTLSSTFQQQLHPPAYRVEILNGATQVHICGEDHECSRHGAELKCIAVRPDANQN